MYCSNCGNAVEINDKFCISCGKSVVITPQPQSNPAPSAAAAQYIVYERQVSHEPAHGFLKFLCFLYFIAGIVLYFLWKDSRPVAAKSCASYSICGLIVQVAIPVVAVCAFYFWIFWLYL